VIFCRNLLIYFDDESRRVAVDNLYEHPIRAASSVWATASR